MAKGKVLVVDDEPDTRSFLTDALKEEDYEVRSVANGEDCLEELEAAEGKFDAVILDVLLPAQTGYDVLKVVRGNWPELPVILVSGKVDKIIRDALDMLGAFEFLEKPVSLDKLLDTVGAAVSKH